MNVQSYAREFLASRGVEDVAESHLVDAAAFVYLREAASVQLKLEDLRALGAMAQFSEREMRQDVLQLLAVTRELPGDTWVSMDATSVKVVERATTA